MKNEIIKIAKALEQGEIDLNMTRNLLLGLFDVSGSLPSDDRIVAEAILAARKVDTEVGLLPSNNYIKMFCLGAKWMRDFNHK